MACCWSRGGIVPESNDSAFDKELLERFSRVLNTGKVMRTSPKEIQRKKLEGSLGIVAQFSADHFGKKRPPRSKCQSIAEAPDADDFNFTKVDKSEVLAIFDETTVLANVSPLAIGHVLIIPRCDQQFPQVLTEDLLLQGLNVLARSGRLDFRLVFNSLLAFASVNHFHFHGMYLDYCGLPDSCFPIEKVNRSLVSGSLTEGRVSIELLLETQWYVRGFVLSAGCREGVLGDNPPGDIEALASLAARLVQEMQKRDIPHNVILAPPLAVKREPRPTVQLMAHEDEAKPTAASPEIYILPRQPETKLREGAGFNAAVCELAGMIVAHSEMVYDGLTEESLKEAFSNDVSLPGSEFDELICRAAWLST